MTFNKDGINWYNAQLGDICIIKGGKRLPKGKQLSSIKTNHPYIKVKDMGETKHVSLNSGFEYLDDETFEGISRYIVNENDLIISIVGTIGLIGIVDKSLESANLTENCVKLIDIKEVTNDYLYYYLKSPVGEYEIKKGVVGSTQPKLPIYNIQKIAISYPSISEQKAITKILSDLDKKIETNNKINQKLEEMAQAIFKQWFVDFEFPNEDGEPYKSSGGEMVESELGIIPKGWKIKRLGELGKVVTGKTPPTKDVENYGNKYNFITPVDMKNESYVISSQRKLSKVGYDKVKTLLTPKNSIGVTCIGSNLGEVYITAKDSFTNQQINSLVLEKEKNFPYLYILLKNMKMDFLNIAGGSAVPIINKSAFSEIKILEPHQEVLSNYCRSIISAFEIIKENLIQNWSLIELRDSLLPKLMSGEIRVPLNNEEN